MNLLIRNGRIIDPTTERDEVGDLLLAGRVIGLSETARESIEVYDATGLWVVPALIDAHVHLREPGGEQKETLATGLAAAAAGGFSAVLAMPNTTPAIDTPEQVRWLVARSIELGGSRIYPVPAITLGRQGRELTAIEELYDCGAVAFSDDGDGLADGELMAQALRRAGRLGVPVAQHSEDPRLSAGGVVHDGSVARELGLKGWPAEAEDHMIARDIDLVGKVGGRLHVSHISTAGGVELVRKAKAAGLAVTAEVTPHHLLLSDQLLKEGSTNAKVNPPLRPAEHVEACRAGLADGTIDIIATDHAPHTAADKEGGFEGAAFGMVGLELVVPLLLELVEQGVIDARRMIDALSAGPARVFGLPGGNLRPGTVADVTLIDPALPHEIDPASFRSKGRNTPFGGRRVPGRAVRTYVTGRCVFDLHH